MEIGKPQRIYRVEPLKDPVPAREASPKTPPAPRREEPQTVPAK